MDLPLSIPNRPVKHCSADNTWGLPSLEDRSLPEQRTHLTVGFLFHKTEFYCNDYVHRIKLCYEIFDSKTQINTCFSNFPSFVNRRVVDVT